MVQGKNYHKKWFAYKAKKILWLKLRIEAKGIATKKNFKIILTLPIQVLNIMKNYSIDKF